MQEIDGVFLFSLSAHLCENNLLLLLSMYETSAVKMSFM